MEEFISKMDGVEVEVFDHLPNISNYNSNYYHYKGHLLYEKSDDMDSSEWYLIGGVNKPVLFGMSTCLDDVEVIRTDE